MKGFIRGCRLASALLILACGDSPPPTEPDPSIPTTLTASSAASLAGVAGAVVSPAPSVIVRDQNNAPMANVAVVFTVAGGGGTVSGGNVTTSSEGIALVGGWTLGPVPGENILTASSGTLTPVSFTALSGAGAAAAVAKNGGDNQSAIAGSPVPVAPSVLVKDANGNPKPGVAVAFAVASGGGSITGASATTNAAGIAAVGSWTLGAAGANTLSATVAGLPPVVFTAQAASNFCTNRTDHTFGTVSSGLLTTTDCKFPDGSFVDFYTTTLPESGAYLFREGAAFDAYLLLAMPDGTAIAENDDESDTITNSAIKALLPAGDYLIAPGTYLADITGPYEISSTVTSADNANCEVVFVVRNVTTTQNLATTDCILEAGGNPIYADFYFIFLRAGSTVTINMTSGALDSFLQLRRSEDGSLITQNDNVDSSTKNARITYTAAETNYYAIFASAGSTPSQGTYTLSIQ